MIHLYTRNIRVSMAKVEGPQSQFYMQRRLPPRACLLTSRRSAPFPPLLGLLSIPPYSCVVTLLSLTPACIVRWPAQFALLAHILTLRSCMRNGRVQQTARGIGRYTWEQGRLGGILPRKIRFLSLGVRILERFLDT